MTRRFNRNLFQFVLIALALIFTVSIGSAAQPENVPRSPRGEQAIAQLGDRLPDVARAYGLQPEELRELFRSDNTLSVDSNGELYYVDIPFPNDAELSKAEALLSNADSSISAASVPALESRPGAEKTIFLDFDGHTTQGTTWNSQNNVSSIVSPPYDLDGTPGSFNATELNRINRVWQIVAEDFSPFDINVTTIDPGSAALSRSGSGDTEWGVRVIITGDDWNNCGCGGFAYIGAFDDSVDEPVYVFNSSETGVSEAASHEVGHAMNLSHDGTSTLGYYGGHGSGETSWGTIMGAGYNRNVTQWSQGDYFDSNNNGSGSNYGNGPDDLAVIASFDNGNGFGYRPDDHGDSNSVSSPLATNGLSVTGTGVIEQTSDVDVHRFVTGAGAVSLTILPDQSRPNLDILAELYDSSNNLVGSSNPGSTLSASINVTLAAGTYYLHIDGTGTGSPFNSSPTGYVEYGSIGQYAISGTVQDNGGGDVTPPAAPTGLSASAGDGSVDLSWNANGEGDLAGYTIYRSTNSGGPYTAIAGLQSGTSYTDGGVTNGTTYYYVVTASDTTGNESADSNEADATPSGGPADTPDVAAADYGTVRGSVSGTYQNTTSQDDSYQALTETHSGGRPANRYDSLDHVWTFNLSGGNHIFEIDAYYSDAGDADSGFDLSWSTSPTGPWNYILTVNGNSDTDSYQSADLGAVSGTIYVQASDTDQTRGQRSYDTLYVDHMQISGGTPPTNPPGPASNPQPADGATGLGTATTLSWGAGSDATSHDVYFGTASGALSFAGNQSSTSYDPGALAQNTTYYWRVDEVNAIGTTTGTEWSFTTGSGPTSIHVQSITLQVASGSRGAKFGQAIVVVADNEGNVVGSVVVNGDFSGSFNESVSATTGGNGSATLTTSAQEKKPSFQFCVTGLSGSLPYNDADNAMTCASY